MAGFLEGMISASRLLKQASERIWRQQLGGQMYWKIYIEHNNGGLVQMIFLCKWVMFRFHVNLPGCM